MRLKDEINVRLKDFAALCLNHKVKNLYAFGSSITDQFDEATSDLDFLVEIDDPDPIGRGENLISLWDNFEEFFHRKVDLLTESSIKNPILRNSIDRTKIKIYDGKRQKILI